MKKLIFSLMAIAIGVAVWAIVPRSVQKQVTENTELEIKWFQYIGGDPSSPNSYELRTMEPDCEGFTNLCAIQATSNAGSPERPTQDAIDALAVASNNFTQPVANTVLFEN